MRILIAGASSALGQATAAALSKAGHLVIAVGSDAGRLEAVKAAERRVCDLTSLADVQALGEAVGDVDGLVHLVGGWRGGGGLVEQSDDDWEWLERRIVTTLRNTTRVLADGIGKSEAGAIVLVSTTGLERPTAGNASYVALKAAAETWLAAVGHALRQTPAEIHVRRVKALVSAADREASPDRAFDGYTDVTDLAADIAQLFTDRTNGRTYEHTREP